MKLLKNIFENAITKWVSAILLYLFLWLSGIFRIFSDYLIDNLSPILLANIFLATFILLLTAIGIIFYLTYPKIIRSKYEYDKRYGIYRHKKSGDEYCYNGLHKKHLEEHPLQKIQEDFICHKCEKIFEDSKKDRFPMARG